MDDLKTTLIDVYETLLFQQKLLTEAALRAQAVTTVMMNFQEFAEKYPTLLADIENGPIAQRAALIAAVIEQKLRALREEDEELPPSIQ
jgi:hypothetical protein